MRYQETEKKTKNAKFKYNKLHKVNFTAKVTINNDFLALRSNYRRNVV